MLFGAVILFFLTGVVTVYAIIQTGKNYALQTLMIPLILVSTVFAGYAIYILQGTPKRGVPDYEVEIVFVEMQKPNIIFLARDITEGASPIPKYYIIDYNDPNKKMVNEMKKKMEMGIPVEGKFEQKKPLPGGQEPPTGEFEFDDIRRDGLPSKQAPANDYSYGPAGEFEGVDPGIQNRLIERGDYDRFENQTPPSSLPQGSQIGDNIEDYDIFEDMQLEESKEYLERYN